MRKLVGLFLLITFASSMLHSLEVLTPTCSEQTICSNDISNLPFGKGEQNTKIPACPAKQCADQCDVGHCHPVGILASNQFFNRPIVDSVLSENQSAHSVFLQEDTRPPRA